MSASDANQQGGRKKMDHAAKNLRGLTPTEQATKGRRAVVAAGTPAGIVILGTPAPPEVSDLNTATTELENANTDLAGKSAAMTTAENRVAAALIGFSVAYGNYVSVGDSRSKGIATNITTLELDVAGTATPAGPTPRVQNVKLTTADSEGHVDVSCDSLLKLARLYDIQTTLALDPANPGASTWANQPSSTKSNATIGPFASGTRIWVRMRATGTKGPGEWSDPATIIVP
jgi:hypothetical protein